MQAKCAIELFDARPLSWMESEETVIGTVWLSVELATFTGTILVNILFMFLRSFREPSVRIELVDKRKALPSVDTVEAMSTLMSQYLALGVPCWVIFKITDACYVPRLDVGHKTAMKLGYAMLARFVLANFLIFVDWRTGPKWWLKVAPTVMYLLTLTNYILFPLASIFWFFMNWTKMGKSVYGIYEQTVAIIWILQMVFYFQIIGPYIFTNAKVYITRRAALWEQKGESADADRSNASNTTVDFPNPNAIDSGEK